MTGIDVWLVPVVAGVADDARRCASLAAGERETLAALGFAADRDRAVTARFAARHILGRRLRLHPRLVPLAVAGRTVLAGCNVGVSWSHSGGWVALAVAADRPVGVDIERWPEHVPYRALARMGLASLEDFVAAEAAGKASGHGLSAPAADDVTVRAVPAPPRYLAAVAAPGDDWSVRTRVTRLVDLEDAQPTVAALPAMWSTAHPATATGAFWVLPAAASCQPCDR